MMVVLGVLGFVYFIQLIVVTVTLSMGDFRKKISFIIALIPFSFLLFFMWEFLSGLMKEYKRLR